MSDYNGKLNQEIEITVYARLPDLAILEKAPTKEEHEQWQLPFEIKGAVKARLRMIDNRRYTMTTKAKRPGVTGVEEVNFDIPEAAFKHLKETATNGYKKTRYNFPIPGTDRKWEVDVFMDKSGSPHNWVKIDIELKSKDDEIPLIDTDLGATEFIIENHPRTTKEEEAKIRSLWENEWQQINKVSV